MESEEYEKDSVSNSSIDDADSLMDSNLGSTIKPNHLGDILNNLPNVSTNIFEVGNEDCSDDDSSSESNFSDDDSVSEYNMKSERDLPKNISNFKLKTKSFKY